MARLDIKRFQENKSKSPKVHGVVDGDYCIFTAADGTALLQIDTFGSDERQISGKVSQSLQFDADTLKLLSEIYHAKFENK